MLDIFKKVSLKKFFLCIIGFILGATCLKLACTQLDLGYHNNVLVLSALCFAFICQLWEYKLRFILTFIFCIFVYLSMAYLKLMVGAPLTGKEILNTLSCATFIFSILYMYGWFLIIIPVRWLRISGKVLFYLLFFLVMVLPLGMWGYYFLSGQLLSGDIILTLFQTNAAETKAYLNMQNLLHEIFIALLILLGIVFFIYLNKKLDKFNCNFSKYKTFGLVVMLIFTCATLFPKLETFYALSMIKSADTALNSYSEYQAGIRERQEFLSKLPNLSITPGQGGIYVLVIGESETRDHMGAYGYQRDTTPKLSNAVLNEHNLLFKNAYSCHTHTVPCLTYALTQKNQYNKLGSSSVCVKKKIV